MNYLVILLAVLPGALSMLCNDMEYWSADLGQCLLCRKCAPHEITLKKCQPHSNTQCSTIPELDQKFAFHSNDKKSSLINEIDEAEDELIRKQKPHHSLKFHEFDDTSNDDDDDIFQDFLKRKHDLQKSHEKQHHKNHKKHYSFKQRINDKFLDWDDESFEQKNHHKNFDIFAETSHKHPKHHHFVSSGEHAHREKSKNHMKDHRSRKSKKYNKMNKDEEKLEELLKLSRKQFKQKKEDLLKNMKQDELEFDEESKTLRLNYPLYNSVNNNTLSHHQMEHVHTEKSKSHSETDDEIFKELMKKNAAKDFELESLMTNKKDNPGYRSVTPSHRLFLGEPSTVSEMLGQVKDPQDVIKQEMGPNVIYEKSKFSIVPLVKEGDGTVISAVPFTAAERFVWDWQAVAVVSAVTACLLFFMVVATYGILNTRSLRRATKTPAYTADMEEMSTRISLMHPAIETSAADGHSTSKYLDNVLNIPKN